MQEKNKSKWELLPKRHSFNQKESCGYLNKIAQSAQKASPTGLILRFDAKNTTLK